MKDKIYCCVRECDLDEQKNIYAYLLDDGVLAISHEPNIWTPNPQKILFGVRGAMVLQKALGAFIKDASRG